MTTVSYNFTQWGRQFITIVVTIIITGITMLQNKTMNDVSVYTLDSEAHFHNGA